MLCMHARGRRATPSQVCSCRLHLKHCRLPIRAPPTVGRLILRIRTCSKDLFRLLKPPSFSSNASRYVCRVVPKISSEQLRHVPRNPGRSMHVVAADTDDLSGTPLRDPVCSTTFLSVHRQFHLSTPGSLQLPLLCDQQCTDAPELLTVAMFIHICKQLGGFLTLSVR